MNKDIKTKINDIMKAYVDACLAGKSEEEQKYQQLILEFDQKMREKYN